MTGATLFVLRCRYDDDEGLLGIFSTQAEARSAAKSHALERNQSLGDWEPRGDWEGFGDGCAAPCADRSIWYWYDPFVVDARPWESREEGQ